MDSGVKSCHAAKISRTGPTADVLVRSSSEGRSIFKFAGAASHQVAAADEDVRGPYWLRLRCFADFAEATCAVGQISLSRRIDSILQNGQSRRVVLCVAQAELNDSTAALL